VEGKLIIILIIGIFRHILYTTWKQRIINSYHNYTCVVMGKKNDVNLKIDMC
jgi:hypothetical protein